MADPISWIVATAKAVAAAVASFAAAHPIAFAAAKIVASVALSAALRPDVPKPATGKFTIRQSRPPRRYGVGMCRVSGPFALIEARENVLHQIIMLPEGPVASFGRFWFHDDEIEVIDNVVQEIGKGAYANGRVRLYWRYGAVPETAYEALVAEWPEVWTVNHRLDGIPSLYARCEHKDVKHFAKLYPNGRPEPSVEALYAAYDWRKDSTAGGSGSHRRDDPTTWEGSRNPIVWAVNVHWRRFGADWDARFAPSLALLTAEADYCDETVALKAGGSEPRYACGFFFESTNPFGQVQGVILDSMDGWFGQRPDGAYVYRAGRFYTPTVRFGDKEVLDWEFDPGPLPEDEVHRLAVSFTDPARAYSEVEVTPWVLMEGERTESFYPFAVQSNGQVRRLAKRQRLNAATGRFTTRLSARRGLGERFVSLDISDSPDLAGGVPVEIVDAEVDLEADLIAWEFRVADPDIDAWDPATEEGDGPLGGDRPTPVGIGEPVITSTVVLYEGSSGGGYTARVQIFLVDLGRDDLGYQVRWRSVGSTYWNVDPYTEGAYDGLGDLFVTSSVVPSDTPLEFQVAYVFGGGAVSDWSASAFETADSEVLPPDPPTTVLATGGVGQAEITWSNPNSEGFAYAKVFRGSALAAFEDAVAASGELAGAPGASAFFTDTGLSAGGYRWWVVAYSDADVPSAPAGPASDTVE